MRILIGLLYFIWG